MMFKSEETHTRNRSTSKESRLNKSYSVHRGKGGAKRPRVYSNASPRGGFANQRFALRLGSSTLACLRKGGEGGTQYDRGCTRRLRPRHASGRFGPHRPYPRTKKRTIIAKNIQQYSEENTSGRDTNNKTQAKQKKRVCPILTLEGKKRTDTLLLDLSDNQNIRVHPKKTSAVTNLMTPVVSGQWSPGSRKKRDTPKDFEPHSHS